MFSPISAKLKVGPRQQIGNTAIYKMDGPYFGRRSPLIRTPIYLTAISYSETLIGGTVTFLPNGAPLFSWMTTAGGFPGSL